MRRSRIHLTMTADNLGVVEVRGRIGAHAAPLLKDHILMAGNDVVVEFRDAVFVDAVPLGVLLAATKKIRNAGGDVRLVTTGAEMRSLVRTFGLDQIFEVASDRREFAYAKAA